jgi:hypothetical protein
MSLLTTDYVIFLPPSLPLVQVRLMAAQAFLLFELTTWWHSLISFIDMLPAVIGCAGIEVCRDAFVS